MSASVTVWVALPFDLPAATPATPPLRVKVRKEKKAK